MISTFSALSLMLASQAVASPIFKRQSQPAGGTDNVVTSPSVVATSTATTDVAQPTQQATDTAAYPCPDGYFLTYTEEQMTYPNTPLQVLRQYIGDFQNAPYFGHVNGTGGNEVGATRTLVSGHQEVLVEQLTDIPDTNIVTQTVFNLTNGPIDVGSGTTLSGYQTVLQVIRNVTASPQNDDNDDNDNNDADTVGTVKIFSNFCASNQAEGRMAQSNAFQGALNNLNVLIGGGSLTQDNFPEVTRTVQTTFTVAAPTNTFSTTFIANAPTQTVVNTDTAATPTETVINTITPSIATEVETNRVTPGAVTETARDTVTPMASTDVLSSTVTPDVNTVTAQTTINPLLSTSVNPVTAVTTTSV